MKHKSFAVKPLCGALSTLAYLVCFGMVLSLCSLASAEMINEGFFSGMDLEPLNGSSPAILTADPTAVLLFTLDADQATVAAFDAWAGQPHATRVAVYGVLVAPKDSSSAVVEEAIRQRDIKMPLFRVSEESLLDGDKFRVMVLKGRDQQVVEKVDGKAIEAALSETTPSKPVATHEAEATTDALTGSSAPKSSLYTNHRYKYVIRFPSGWDFRVSKNDDGAVGRPPANSALDLRVWGSSNNEDRDGKPGDMTAREYAEQHLETLGSQTKADVSIERRLAVTDGDAEGRDYSYTYVKPNAAGDGTVRFRGRIQVFNVDGMFKVANVEAPVGEYAANRDLIERFMVSFHPSEESEDENENDNLTRGPIRDAPEPGSQFAPFQ